MYKIGKEQLTPHTIFEVLQMSHSKNDFPLAGGTARLKAHPIRGKQDAILLLIDPLTRKPYCYQSLAEALEQRRQQYPTLAVMIDHQMEEIEKKAMQIPQAQYCLTCRGQNTEEALARAKKELFPQVEALSKLLFRPEWESNVQAGNLTVFEFAEYMADSLFPGVSADTKGHLFTSLRRVILPCIGKLRLRELDENEQKKAIRKINRVLGREKAGATQRGYVKRAYKGLFEAIESSGYRFEKSPVYLADILDTAGHQNRALLNSFRPDHLDDRQRASLFAFFSAPELLYELTVLALLYCGFDLCEIAALRFESLQQLVLGRESCYCILADRMVRKLNQRYSTICATNENYPIHRLRVVVLYPWAAEILLRYAACLQEAGYSFKQIAQMRLSDPVPGNAIFGPDEITARIEPLLCKAGISDTRIPRTDKDGDVRMQTCPADISLLRKDAQYVATAFCGANLPMLHAMFGQPWTETDEEAYLDLLSDEYAVARWMRLRRFSPFDTPDAPKYVDGRMTQGAQQRGCYALALHNSTEQPQTLCISSNYAISAYWKEMSV